jgi:hypothetical protein
MSRYTPLAPVLAVLLTGALTGCSGGGGSSVTPALGSAPESVPASGTAAVTAYGVEVMTPAWFPVGDQQSLGAAVGSYVQDVQTQLAGWLPEPGSATVKPLRIILHDTPGVNQYSRSMRTAWLEWPKGASGKPLLSTFMPAFHEVLVHDRRRELNIAVEEPWTQAEVDTAMRGRWLPITLYTSSPDTYEP